ncbi:DUF2508 family protein [Clostridium sp. 'deep sea']|uniref:DUF2508 family protein n=1 Tax=Clostridium sp. 'deep sea' TaxID=2779445 RepID=UPI0018966D3D|nr:DUF2508 family protein [Clostridium sp. 'deep sea']QOR33628.1 DUF2508 family protein [Clostridium sp. 'deep sea']
MDWKKFIDRLYVKNQQNSHDTKNQELLNEVIKAREEWQQAHKYFNSVSEDGLTDHAIMMCQAAEQKYIYLLRLAKQEGVVNNNISIS